MGKRKYNTEEERLEAHRESRRKTNAKRYAKHRERLLREKREKYERNKEKKKAYYEANKEDINARRKAKRQENLEKAREKDREYYRRRRQDGYVVYYLPNEHYVGMTNNYKHRISCHSRTKDVTDAKILRWFDNPFDAHIYETQWHKMGANGFHYIY